MTKNTLIIRPADELSLAGQQANRYAAAGVFGDYQQRTAENTLRRQRADLRLFERYLKEAGLYVCDLYTSPECWRGMTWGIVAGFVQWQLKAGYAVGSVNVRLATIKRYCALAHQAGMIADGEAALVKVVQGYGHKQAGKVDEKRATTRRGQKKAAAVALTLAQVKALKAQPDTPQGRRDAVLMCILLDHGLRCSEMALLKVADFNLTDSTFTFYRPKVDKTQTHRMTPDTRRAVKAYFDQDVPALADALLQGSQNGGRLAGGMSERAINKRVRQLGKAAGIEGLSPHDCRHSWATRAARKGTDPFALQQAGGWNSLAMPARYIEAAKIANEQVKLDDADSD